MFAIVVKTVEAGPEGDPKELFNHYEFGSYKKAGEWLVKHGFRPIEDQKEKGIYQT